MMKREPSCVLEQELFKNVYDKTPDYIKNANLLNFDEENAFTFTLKREHLHKYDPEKNPALYRLPLLRVPLPAKAEHSEAAGSV